MSTLGYLFAAFALAWATVFVYLWLLARRAGSIEAQLERLERRVDAGADSGPSGD